MTSNRLKMIVFIPIVVIFLVLIGLKYLTGPFNLFLIRKGGFEVDGKLPLFISSTSRLMNRGRLSHWFANDDPKSRCSQEKVALALTAMGSKIDGSLGFPAVGQRKCAVVGNGSSLSGSSHGSLIDSFPIVIRMTRAPIQGFERDVGTRTTHHILYSKLISDPHWDRHAQVIHYTVKPYEVCKLSEIFHTGDFSKTARQIKVIHPEFIEYVNKQWLRGQSIQPSTGMMAIALALHLCDEVDAFGFGTNRSGHWQHYYNSEVLKHSRFHSIHGEDIATKELAKRGKLKLHTGVNR